MGGRATQQQPKVNEDDHEDEPEELMRDDHFGGGSTLQDQKAMWGGRASRALESMHGKSTGKTSYENEQKKKQWVVDQRARNKLMETKSKALVGTGESRAALKRKKKKGVEVPSAAGRAEAFRGRLLTFYAAHAPAKMGGGGMEALLVKFAKDEAGLFAMLEEKYVTKAAGGAGAGADDAAAKPPLSKRGKGAAAEGAGAAGKKPKLSADDQADVLLEEYERLVRRRAWEARKADEAALAAELQADSVNDGSKGSGESMVDLAALNAVNVSVFLKQVREAPSRMDK
jgi:hypothetical protein